MTLFIPWIVVGIWALVDAFLIPGIIREIEEKVRLQARLDVSLLQTRT